MSFGSVALLQHLEMSYCIFLKEATTEVVELLMGAKSSNLART